ncbi:MAG: Phosphoserine phosphatase SerB [Candidatus Tokpelaia hoelldobleri]|uniref:Phosphoserine phosphatase n=1 Tax=Candidatus Tokpelaia hoelldobleri TaxID=1902579 RepID=A0A1U9JVU4_9HYPH|nr:MAG: Phosphoserine phosphatase SerB [Candidatus Tokpelaia hoelldoblerii]
MSHSQPLVVTLIANPAQPVLDTTVADKAASAIHASAVYWLADTIACDIPVPDGTSATALYKTLRATLGSRPIDIVVQSVKSRRKKLLVADMDSTMIEQECIDELAEAMGLRGQVADITRRAMNGEIAFEPALRERVALLKGLSLPVIDRIIENHITLMPGGRALVQTMKANGAYTALVSGGFTLFTANIAAKLGFDEHHANTLSHDGEKLNGLVQEPILGKRAKLDTLLALCFKLGLTPDQAIAVGDGANDLAMLQTAGSGVALHARPIVAEAANIRIDHGDLSALLYLQGYRKTDFVS